ncbi:hypothetical protein [Streptococcus gordonii]|uniref:hypothetical protein n=1 Tax=Streptococcus gordonii TaxID=1302 RepID=UPI001CBF9EFF|nr:hypothetical protein [Streptococcus gordonii]MBZ2134250.1 hypothetical protein [Streptococcus gordonii]MBZ2142516.1 hypothetical protein [Streptococcus gordonii]MBZ2144315.1 hypothetical protein [Streptococcus gordonii]MBZ2146420.1 hypothetical protein [Streptococcus gordonii]
MKKKFLAIISILLISFSAGFVYMTQFHSSTGLDRKEEKIIKHGFRLLEEQIGTYIKENYSGISKIEFSPIFIQGGKDNPPFVADIVPVVYDEEGNRAVFGTLIGNHAYASYGNPYSIYLDFDRENKEYILLSDSNGNRINVTNYNKLPKKAKLNSNNSIDNNIKGLIDDGQLKDVIKSDAGSPNAKIRFNVEIKRGSRLEWEQ